MLKFRQNDINSIMAWLAPIPFIYLLCARLIFALVFFPNLFKARPDLILTTNSDHLSLIGGLWGVYAYFLFLKKKFTIKFDDEAFFLLVIHIMYIFYISQTDAFLGQKFFGYPGAFYLAGFGLLISLILLIRKLK